MVFHQMVKSFALLLECFLSLRPIRAQCRCFTYFEWLGQLTRIYLLILASVWFFGVIPSRSRFVSSQDGLRVGEPSSLRAGGGDVIRGAEPPVRAAGGHPESGQLGPQLPHQRRQERLVRRGPGPVGGALSLHPQTRPVGPQPPESDFVIFS